MPDPPNPAAGDIGISRGRGEETNLRRAYQKISRDSCMISIEYFSRLPGQVRTNHLVVPSRVVKKTLKLACFECESQAFDTPACTTSSRPHFGPRFAARDSRPSSAHVPPRRGWSMRWSSFSMERIMPQFRSKSINRALHIRVCEKAAMLELIASVVAPTPGFDGRNEYSRLGGMRHATGRRATLSLTPSSDNSLTHRALEWRGEILSRIPALHDLHQRGRLAGSADGYHLVPGMSFSIM